MDKLTHTAQGKAALPAIPAPAALLLILALVLLPGIPATLAQNSQSDDPVIAELQSLVDMSRYNEAYELARTALFEHEGEPRFDFLYGMAALESGHPEEAVFAFERISQSYPNQQRVRLELARAHFQNDNLAASRTLFSQVLDTEPETNVANNIRGFLSIIEQRERAQRSSFSWYVSSGIGHDTNVNSATNLDVITLPIGDVDLSPDARSLNDSFLNLGAGLSYSRPINKNRSLSVSAAINRNDNFSADAFDLDILSVQGTHSISPDANNRFNQSLRVQRVMLDSTRFQQSASLIGSWQRIGQEGWTQSLTGAYTAVRYSNTPLNPASELRDVNQALISGSLGKNAGSFQHNLSLYLADESILRDAGKNNAQRFYGVAYSQQFQLRPGHIPFLRVAMQKSDHKADYPVFEESRDDELFSATVGWFWQINSKLNFNTDITYTDNDSTIEVFSYDRLKYQTGIRYQF